MNLLYIQKLCCSVKAIVHLVPTSAQTATGNGTHHILSLSTDKIVYTGLN